MLYSTGNVFETVKWTNKESPQTRSFCETAACKDETGPHERDPHSHLHLSGLSLTAVRPLKGQVVSLETQNSLWERSECTRYRV